MIHVPRSLTCSLTSSTRHCLLPIHLLNRAGALNNSATTRSYFSSSTRIRNTYTPQVHLPSRPTAISNTKNLRASTINISKRHCSHRKAMYREEMVGGLAAAQGGREILPTNVKPTHYNLTLEPDLEEFTYQGTVKIEYDTPRIRQSLVV